MWTPWCRGYWGLARDGFCFFLGGGCDACLWLHRAFILLWININLPSTRTLNKKTTFDDNQKHLCRTWGDGC